MTKHLYWIIPSVIVLILVVTAIPFPYTATEAYMEQEPYTSEQQTVGTKQVEDVYMSETKSISSGRKGFWIDRISSTGGNWWIQKDTSLVGTVSSSEPIHLIISKEWSMCGHFAELDFNTDATYEGYNVIVNPYSSLMPAKVEKYNFLNYQFNIPWGGDNPSSEGQSYCLVVWRNEGKDTSVAVDLDIKGVRTVPNSEFNKVTEYRDVQKTRSVTKYAPLFMQWTGQIKWYYEV